jgi:Xaa-Pro aminopeptidase
MGHGIGIEERDHPIIQKPFASFDGGILKGSYDIKLETGMVINIEVNHWEFGVGGQERVSTWSHPLADAHAARTEDERCRLETYEKKKKIGYNR